MIDDSETALEYADTPREDGRADKVMLIIARLIGRQMAREQFENLTASNDNRLPVP
jgi:hypothetical protein